MFRPFCNKQFLIPPTHKLYCFISCTIKLFQHCTFNYSFFPFTNLVIIYIFPTHPLHPRTHTHTHSHSQVYAPRNVKTYYEEFKSLMEWGGDACEKLLASKHIDVLLDLSRDQKFDVLITEFFDTDCALGVAYKLNITSFIGMVCRRKKRNRFR